VTCLPEKNAKDSASRPAIDQDAFQGNQEGLKLNTDDKHGAQHVTAGRSVFNDLFSPAEAAELQIRGELLRGLQDWLKASGKTQADLGEQLGVSQARISDIKHGKINSFSLDLLVRLAVRAGLHPRLELVA
jgi:predicted XRE-type DNA-binding protein